MQKWKLEVEAKAIVEAEDWKRKRKLEVDAEVKAGGGSESRRWKRRTGRGSESRKWMQIAEVKAGGGSGGLEEEVKALPYMIVESVIGSGKNL